VAGLDRTVHGNGAQSRLPSGPPPTFVVHAPIRRSDLSGLVERLRRGFQAGDVELLLCDVAEVVHPDAETVDALARIHLIVRRQGASVYFLGASAQLRDLLGFVGLDELVQICL
jgi:ABC-type transporter Mla MlaB component